MSYRRLLTNQNLEDIFYPIEEKLLLSNPSNFKAIDNESLMLPIYKHLQYLFPNQEIKTSIQSFGKRQFYVTLNLLEQEKTILERDKVYPQLIIENSYDGSIQPKVSAGYLRVICTNGMYAFEECMEVEIKAEVGVEMEQLAPIFELLANIDLPLATFKLLANRYMSRTEMAWVIHEIEQQPAIRYPSRLHRRALLVAAQEADILNTPMSAWLLYNGFNHALNHIPFAFNGLDLRQLDKNVLQMIQKVIHPNYQPIRLPSIPKQTTVEQLEAYTSKMIL